MDSLIFELQIVFYFQLFLSANVRHTRGKGTFPCATKEIDVCTQAKDKIANILFRELLKR